MLDHSSQGSRRHLVAHRDIPQTLTILPHRYDRLAKLVVRKASRSAKSLTVLPRGCHAGPGALADECSFELGQCSDHMEKEPPTGRIGVDVLCEGMKVDTLLSEIFHQLHQLNERSAKTVQAPHHKRVAAFQCAQGFVESWPIESAAGDTMV